MKLTNKQREILACCADAMPWVGVSDLNAHRSQMKLAGRRTTLASLKAKGLIDANFRITDLGRTLL